MLISEQIRVFLFASAVLAVYVLAAYMTAKRVVRQLAGKSPAAGPVDLWIYRTALGLGAFGILCFAYGYLVEPYWPEITHVRLQTPKLPKGSRPIRIVLLSDLHSDPKARLEERLPDIVAAQRADLVLFAGDAINSNSGLPVFKKCVARLAALAPTFAVKGNWDAAFWHRLNLFEGTGVRELDGDAAKVEIEGVELWIAGVAFGSDEKRIGKAVAAMPQRSFRIFLYHSPDEIDVIARLKVDLGCFGHTHGGQVALPFYGALGTLTKFGKRYEAGLYRVGQTWVYVNRGIGMEGGVAPRVRLCARPEVTVIELLHGHELTTAR